MILVFVDVAGGIMGMIGLAILFLGLLVYIIMAGKTNYANAGIAMGFTAVGVVCVLISSLCALYQIFAGETKKKRILGLIELAIIIGLAFWGYKFPFYSQKLTTQYSNIMSIFVTPLWIYVAIVAFHIIKELEEKGIIWSIVIVVFLIVVFVMLGSAIMGMNYFFDNKDFLNWADTHYHYYNKKWISYRINKYGVDNFSTIAPISLEESKNYLLKRGMSIEEAKNDFLKYAKSHNMGYFEYTLERFYEESPNIYICDFSDPYQYTDDNKVPHYYCKIDFSNFTIVEILDYYYKITEKAMKYTQEGISSFYAAIEYGTERCKVEGEAITKENLNKHIGEIKSKYYCYSVEPIEENKYKVVIGRNTDGEWSASHNAERYIVDATTYKIQWDI